MGGKRRRREIQRALVERGPRGLAPCRMQRGRGGHEIEQDDEKSAQVRELQ